MLIEGRGAGSASEAASEIPRLHLMLKRETGQSEVKRSRRNFEAGQAVKLGIVGSLRTVKVSPSDRWAWLMQIVKTRYMSH